MKYLIYCGPGIGDWIMVLPMARLIKRHDPDAHISAIMTSDKNRIKLNKELLGLQMDIDDVDYYSIDEIGHLMQFFMHLGVKKYDYGFVLQYTDNETTSAWPCRIVNFASKKTCGIELVNKPHVKYTFGIRRKPHYRIVDYPKLMLEKIGISTNINIEDEDFLNHKVIISAFDSLNLELDNKPLIALVIGSAVVSGKVNGKFVSNTSKNWPYEYWIRLAIKLANSGYNVAFLGGEKEKKELAINCCRTDENKVVNLLGKCSIIESLSVISKSCIVVGADTGLMHCAGAMRVPSLTLFGCTDSAEYLPFGKESYWIAAGVDCSPCFGTRRALLCENKKCMTNISVEKVWQKILEILS